VVEVSEHNHAAKAAKVEVITAMNRLKESARQSKDTPMNPIHMVRTPANMVRNPAHMVRNPAHMVRNTAHMVRNRKQKVKNLKAKTARTPTQWS